MAADVLARVRCRLAADGDAPDGAELEELLRGVSDRVRMRLGVEELPALAESVVVDATVKAVRRRWYEGVQSESAGVGATVSTTFVDDILAEYGPELDGVRAMLAASGASGRARVRLL